MREILFRGRIKNAASEWIESCNINTQYDYNGEKHVYIGLYYENPIYPLQKNIDWVEVIPETVGQFTGLIDKNGKKIFEGDVLTQGKDKWVVEWTSYDYEDTEDNVMIGTVVCKDIDGNWFYISKRDEVIGNIHDNPELLGE